MRISVYAHDEDLDMFGEIAEWHGGNVSSAVTEAVKRYYESRKTRDEVVIEVGYSGGRSADDTKRVSFTGKLLATAVTFHGQTSDGMDRGTDWCLYMTGKGKYLVRWETWSKWDGERNIADYDILEKLPQRGDVLYGKATDEESPPVPGHLVTEAAESSGASAVERLDV